MKLWSDSFANGAAIPATYAFGKHNPDTNVELSDNKSPHLAWSGAPAGTKSFALICHDVDVPSRGDDVNQTDRTVPASLPRVDFYHWVLVDLAPELSSLAAGAFCDGITPHGKAGPDSALGTRSGVNDYTGWFAGDDSMRGDYYGYDGPCPPFNDERLHHYHFTLYALDLERCPVEGRFTGADVLAALEGHVLATAALTGTYHIYPGAKSAPE